MALPELVLNVFRFDPEEDREGYFRRYVIPFKDGMTVLDALFHVLERVDGSIAFRYSCREAICGACAMFINGSYRLACQTQIKHLGGNEVDVSPLPHLKVIKDLVVDMTPFWEKYEYIKPYLMASSAPPEKERRQSPRERRAIDEMVGCILCGCCYSSCPSVWTGQEYLGPTALMKAYRFAADSRDGAREERLALVANEKGLWRCHTIFNCAEACPKKINPTYSIQRLKRLAVLGR